MFSQVVGMSEVATKNSDFLCNATSVTMHDQMLPIVSFIIKIYYLCAFKYEFIIMQIKYEANTLSTLLPCPPYQGFHDPSERRFCNHNLMEENINKKIFVFSLLF